MDLTADIAKTESEFKRLWHHANRPTPVETAYYGGAIAGNLSLLFLAGYQAAIRHTFDLGGDRWVALAVSEDRSPENPKPGLTIDAENKLNGFKTWVAGSDHLDQIIVSTGVADDLQLFMLDCNTPGLTITTKSDVRFLAGMSQGVAAFDQVSAPAPLSSPNMKLFSKREPLYLYIAFCGFLKRQLPDVFDEQLLTNLTHLAGTDFTEPSDKDLFANCDDQVNAMFLQIDPAMFDSNYTNDKGVMTLYSKVIQKRAGRGG